jgi:signal recognition particle subunit SRP54
MVLDNLGSSLKNTLSKIKNSITVDRTIVEEVVKEIQKALLSADVNVRLVLELTKNIRKRAIEENNAELSKKEHLITIIYEELASFLGDGKEFELVDGQNRMLLVGLYGQGKTTTSGKLGLYFKNRGKKVALLSTDTWRPAAYEQLRVLGESLGIDVYGNPNEKNPVLIYQNFHQDLEKYDVVIIDSAGRDSLNQELVEEIGKLREVVQPTETFFVLGADVGQTAQKQAEMFKEQVEITGVIITKMDGTGKGGGALSACSTVNAPVRFIGVGERVEDLERFNSKRFVSELLGMGDIEGLLEKAQLAIDSQSAEKLQERMMRGEFDLDDLALQLDSMNKMGSFSKILNLIPGLGGMNIDKSQLGAQEEKIKRWKYAMSSMTKFERKHPEELSISRLKRISSGSGVSISDIRELLKQFKQTKKMMTMFKDPSALEEMMGKGGEGMPGMDINDPQSMMKMMKKMGMGKQFKQMMKRRGR